MQYADTQEQYQLVSEHGRVTYKGQEMMKVMESRYES
jgi:predicted DNA-binding WGR domain protein